MLNAIIIKLEHFDREYPPDGYAVEKVISTKHVQCTVVYPGDDSENMEVEVKPARVMSLMAPIPFAELSNEEALNLIIGPTTEGLLQPSTIAGVLKNRARLCLKDMGEDPNEWGLSVKTEAYKFVCYGKYSGEVYHDDGN